MTKEKLELLNSLAHEIAKFEDRIRVCKEQKCEWIEFGFGNGSSSASVCNDPQIIKKVRDLILAENEAKLLKLRKEFESL